MLNIASVRFTRRITSVLCVVTMAALLTACAHESPPDPGKPASWVVENVASKSTAELYAKVIAPAVFELLSSKVIDGYTVESGNLRMSGKSIGSLVTVRSENGSLTALVDMPGTQGLLLINAKGEGVFEKDSPSDDLSSDGIPNPHKKTISAQMPVKSIETLHVVDIFIGYSKKAAERVGDPHAHAHALAQVESINLSLRNSLVSTVSFRLVGIQVVNQEYLLTVETLDKLLDIFATGIRETGPDLVFGFFPLVVGSVPGQAGGWAYLFDRVAIGSVTHSTIFRHEIGHNAGGDHCNDEGITDYHFGYHNGTTGDVMCQKGILPIYSNPQLKDESGRPLGDAVTADMARVWRENAERLSSYAPPHPAPAAPEKFTRIGSTASTITFGWGASPKAVRYEIYSMKTNGIPTLKKIGDSTTLTFTATNVSGEALYLVKSVNFAGIVSVASNTVVTRP